MKRVIPPIGEGTAGEPASNVIRALMFLIEKGAIPANPVELMALGTRVRPELDAARFGNATGKLMRLVQIRLGLGDRGGQVDTATAELLNRLLEQHGGIESEPVPPPPPPPPEQPPRKISGFVLLDDGTPAVGLALRLFRIPIGGGEAKIGDAVAADSGAYFFSYPPADGEAALQIRAPAPDGTETALTRTLIDLEADARIDLVAASSMQPVKAEFTRLSADLGAAAGGLAKLAEAREDGERADISLLNRATGWDSRIIALASNAARLNVDGVPLSPEATYGLLRAGLPSSKEQLARVEPEAVELALKKSAAEGIVELTAPQIDEAVGKFGEFAAKSRLAETAPGSRSTFGELLEASGASNAGQAKFASLLADGNGGGDLWTKAADAGISSADIGALKQSGKLNFLTLNNHRLAGELRESGIAEAAQLVDNDFDKAETWQQKLRSLAGNSNDALDALIPPAYAAATTAERLTAYSEDMARKVRIAFPTQVVAASIARDTADGLGLGGAREDTAKLLSQSAAAGFTLGAQPVRKFIDANPSALDGIAADRRADAVRGLARVQRVYQLAPGSDAMNTLTSLGLTSAFDITALTEVEFLDRHARHFKSAGEARLVYRKAQQVSSVTYNLFTIARKFDGDVPVYGVSAAPDEQEAVRNELIKQFPTMEGLFGSMDYCECEHCRSVLSPAAYLVDLMQFLDADPLVWQNYLADWKEKHGNRDYGAKYAKPFDALAERRPDLQHIPLTCENTNVAMPYIDIVNEILEYFIANGALDAGAAKDTGTATTAELLAEPQNVIASAYETLRSEKYPLVLPFDLWLETIRAFCRQFDVELADLLDTFRKSDALVDPAQPYDRSAVFLESLGLSPSEIAIFCNPDPLKDWFKLYGFTKAADALTEAVDGATGQRIDINSAKALSRRLGITYQELADIIETGFVNPALSGFAFLYKLGLRPADIYAYGAGKALYDANKDLVGAERSALSAADQARFDALTKAEWNQLHETAAFVDRLTAYAADYPSSAIDLRKMVDDGLADNSFDQILVLADPDAGCDFDRTIVRFAGGAAADAAAFLRINLFVRLWRKLGWSIAETDQALGAFIPSGAPFIEENFAKLLLKSALIALAHARKIETRVKGGRNGRPRLLSLWSTIPATGKNPLYAQLFLTRGVLKADPAFDDPIGRYLTADTKLKDHLPVLQGALGMTAEDIRLALRDSGADPETVKLTMAAVSIAHRYGFLARALGLKVAELVAAKELVGVDPFAALPADPITDADSDMLRSRTLEFIDRVDALKAASLKIDELDFLVRHRFDATGKLRPDDGARLALVRSIAKAIAGIETEHAAPADPAGLGDDVLRQKLGLILPPDVVARLMGMLGGTLETTAVLNGVAPADQLDMTRFAGEPAIVAASYDATRQQQRLTVRGVLFDDVRDDMLSRLPMPVPPAGFAASAVLKSLLEDVQAQQGAFFKAQLRKTAAGVEPASGFLDDADFDLLFRPPSGTAAQIQKRLRDRRTRLAEAFLPYLKTRLVRQLVVETLGAQLGLESDMAELLLASDMVLSGAAAPLAAAAALAAKGASVTWRASEDGSGGAIGPKVAANIDSAGAPAAARSARFAAYFEVPERGAYRFFVALDKKDAEARLKLDHLAAALISGAAGADGAELSEFVELEAGRFYRLELELDKLGGGGARLLIQGESLPKGSIARLDIYPDAAVKAADAAIMRASKVQRIAALFGLTSRELRHIARHGADFGGLDFNLLPAGPGEGTLANARQLVKGIGSLADYASLKAEIDAGEGLIDVLAAPALDGRYAAMAALTRRDKMIVREAAEALWTAPEMTETGQLARLWDALKLAQQLGAGPQAVASWTKIADPKAKAEDRAAAALAAKAAIKSRFDPEAWQRAAQPVHDELRQMQRDALVAYVMHKQGFDRREQLYEYFLIDPGMEPVVQTSRIRLAIGSVQLFIHRCLLNLEKKVPPSVLNAAQWGWMSRYRVWEANRKIFLFPENWLEPEFRTDKTHLFAELEGTLLQGDVSSDLVEDALLTYLEKLDELARLELVALHLEDNREPALRRLHLFGRTHGTPHKYFYRRLEHGVWRPWEPVTPKIDGDHLAPVIWRDRLYLFWVTFEFRADAPSEDTTVKAPPVTIEAARQLVDVKLYWASYLKGKWSAAEASAPMNVEKPVTVQGHGGKGNRGGGAVTFMGTLYFPLRVPIGWDPAGVTVHVTKEAYEEGEERGVFVHLGGELEQAIYLAGRHATPELLSSSETPDNPYSASAVRATRYRGYGALKVTFRERIETEPGKAVTENKATPVILGQGRAFHILPCNSRITLGNPDLSAASDPAAVAAAASRGLAEIATLSRPFFYQDDRVALFALPNVEERTIEQWEEWVQPQPPANPSWRVPDYWKELPVVPSRPNKSPIPIGPDDYFPHGGTIVDLPAGGRGDWLTNPATSVRFGDQVIGRTGRTDLAAGAALSVSNLSSSVLSPAVAGGALATEGISGGGVPSVSAGTRVLGNDGFTPILSDHTPVLDGSAARFLGGGFNRIDR